MFNSGIKVSELIEQLKDEVDIAIPILDVNYIQWLNALEQLLYTELIQEQGKIELDGTDSSAVIDFNLLEVPTGESRPRYEDIHAVYADKTQLIETTVASGDIFPNTYYKMGNNLYLHCRKAPTKVKIIYFVKPELKKESDTVSQEVMVPVEFIDLVKAKLRGEAYKLANEDGIAAKWLNDYNILLETFKAWLSGKQSEFGL